MNGVYTDKQIAAGSLYRAEHSVLEHFPPKPALDLIGGGCRFGAENASNK